MKYKKGFIFICLIICLFGIASVCAGDVNETMITDGNQYDGEMDASVENALSASVNETIVENDDVMIGENLDDGEVDGASEGSSEVLYSVESDDVLSYAVEDDVLGASPPYSAYSVSVSDTTINYGSSGSIVMSISPASSSYSYRYDFYLKVYDSNGNQKISQLYYGSSSAYSKTYSVSSFQLDPGTYTIKLVNYADSYVMDTANLYVVSVPHTAYSVSVSDIIVNYGYSNNNIVMSISPASSSYYYRYDFYLKVFNSSNVEKISQRYYSSSSNTQVSYYLSSTQLSPGSYKIKLINSYDNQVMCTADLTVLTLTYDSYSVGVSDTTINYGSSGSIKMSISPASSSYYYRYDFYLKVYDSKGNQKISERYYSSSSNNQVTYNVYSSQLDCGSYTIKLINAYDNQVMCTAKLFIVSVPYYAYSVGVSDTAINYWSSGSIKMSISPASSLYSNKYDFYLKVYDSEGNVKISSRYYSSSSSSQVSYSVGSYQLSPGSYVIKLINTHDNYIMGVANLTVLSVPYSAYSVGVSDTTINYGSGGSIVMSISPASSSYYYRYDFYLKVYDSNGNEKITQRYYSSSSSSQESYSVSSQLNPGSYTIKLVNVADNYVMDSANLTVKSVPYSAYSVSVSDTSINYWSSGSIAMSISPASSSYYYRYDFYLKVYDSNGNEKITQRYYGSSSVYSKTYSVGSYQLDPGSYTIKLVNFADNHVMDSANLTVKSVPYSAYSVSVSDTTINYGSSGSIAMSISPASSSYYYRYDFYLKVYDSNGNEKISERYYSSSSNYKVSYSVGSSQLSFGNYTIKLINVNDNRVMDTAKLTVESTYSSYSVSVSDTMIDYVAGGSIVMSISPASSSYGCKYDFYLKVYDSEGDEVISERYYSTNSDKSKEYTVGSSQLAPGSYTIKLINAYNGYVKSTAKLTVNSVPYYAYSVGVSDTAIAYGSGGDILMSISPSSPSYYYKYDFYLKVYDSEGNEKISERYYSSNSSFKVSYKIGSQLNCGSYTIRLINAYDCHVMDSANLTVLSVPCSVYSVSVSDTTIIYGSNGNIVMNISPASYQYNYFFDFYLKVYDYDGNEVISERYYGFIPETFVNYTIGSTKLSPGRYTIRLINNVDNYLFDSAELSVVSVPYSAYSVNVSDTIINYGVGGRIVMNISPADASCSYRYDYYLRVYDSDGAEVISKRYYNASSVYSMVHSVGSTQLNPGNYTIKVINTHEGHIMSVANLTVIALTHDVYSVNVSDVAIVYGSSGIILMNISGVPSVYSKKYDFYLKVYDSGGVEKISKRYYSSSETSQITYTISSTYLSPGSYTIKLINAYDEYVLDSANLTVLSVPYTAYSVDVSDTIIAYGVGGSIVMNITPANSSYSYKYDFYLKVYDSDGVEKISTRYYSSNSKSQVTYAVSSTKLSRGNYVIKLINAYDDYVLDSANLTVLSVPDNAYSVDVSDTTIACGSSGNIIMSISSANSSYTYKYDFYLKVYDSDGVEKISTRYYSSNSKSQVTYTVSSTKLSPGSYMIKLINAYDDYVLDSANLTVLSVPYDAYSVDVSDTTINYDSIGTIVMDIAPTSLYNYKYDYYLKVYDSNDSEIISYRYYSSSATSQVTYSVSSYQLSPGSYTIKLINTYDDYVLDSANLSVVALTYDAYSVDVSDTTINYGTTGSIVMNITPASSAYYKKYDFYLKVYDSNGSVMISERYYGTSSAYSKTYSVGSYQLSPGSYTIKLINTYDDYVLDSANLSVVALTYDAYSVNVFDTLITYGVGGSIVMNITSASSAYYKKYDFYLKVYDSNGNQKISQRYYSSNEASQVNYTISSTYLSPGSYVIKLINTYDDYVLDSANLSVVALTYDAYSVNVSDISVNYDVGGTILMNIVSANSSYDYKYNFYLRIYDSNGNQKISQRYYSSNEASQVNYTISSTYLSPGSYVIKLINAYDNHVMDNATLNIVSVPYSAYQVDVSDTNINYWSSGSILMNIVSANSSYSYKYDFYLKIYDSNGVEKISSRYYSSSSNSQVTYSVSSTQFTPGSYTIKLINNVDNHVMDNATLNILSVPHSAYWVDVSDTNINYEDGGNIVMSISPASSYNYKYDFYLKVYDSNSAEMISERYYGTSSTYSKTYSLSSNKLSPGIYAIKIVNSYDNYVMDNATLTVFSVPYDAYSVNVSDTIINYGFSGDIVMNIVPANSSYSYKYDFYLKVYDSNGTEMISQKYYSSSSDYQVTYSVGSDKFTPGNYIIKLINVHDDYVMDVANLTVVPLTYDAYSVSASDVIITHGFDGFIQMNIVPASSIYSNKYDFYLKVYDSRGNVKISKEYCSSSSNAQEVYNIRSNQLALGSYVIKLINAYDSYVMDVANLTVVALTYDAYSVSASDAIVTYGFNSSIFMNISPASSPYLGKYDFYIVGYDSNGNEIICERYYSSSSNAQETYNIGSNQLAPGNYIIKLFNAYDSYVMDVANLFVVALTYDVYSVNVSDTTIAYDIGGGIVANIVPATDVYSYKYDFYLKVYDSNNTEMISQRYYSPSSDAQETCEVGSGQLTPGNYTVKLINNYDSHVFDVANLTVLSVPYSEYSVSVSDTILTYGDGGSIVMSISPASSAYSNKYDFYLIVYDSNDEEIINQRYYSSSPNVQETYNLSSYQLNLGSYKIKLLNNIDNHVMDVANLTVVPLSYDVYSVSVSDTAIDYGVGGSIVMSISPASSIYSKKYDFYLRIYDSNGYSIISQRYYSSISNTQESYSIGATRLDPGNYIIKLSNNYDGHIMSEANLTIASVPYDAYSVSVNNTTISYEGGGSILMDLTSDSNSYYKYDFYFKVYDSNGDQKISKRYYSTTSSSQLEYSVGYAYLNRGIYTIKILNNVDNHEMASATLHVLGSPNLEILSQDYYVGDMVEINYSIDSRATGNLSVYVNDTFVKNVSAGENIELGNMAFGEYVVKVIYGGDDYYYGCEDTVAFEVHKVLPTLILSVNNITVADYDYFQTNITSGNDIVIEFIFDDDINGDINISHEFGWGHWVDYTLKLVNGTASLIIPNVMGGSHYFTIDYGGDDKYLPYYAESEITFNYKQPYINYTIPDNLLWGDTFAINPVLPDDVTGEIEISVYGDNGYYFNDVMDVKDVYNLTIYNGDINNLELYYLGDEYYSDYTYLQSFTVIKLNSTCSVTGNIEAGDYSTINVTLNEDATGSITVLLNNKYYSGELENGSYVFSVPNIKAGIYNVTIDYGGDSKYNAFNKDEILNVTLKKTIIALDLKNIIYDSNMDITPIISDGATGYIDVYVDDVFKGSIKIGSSYPLQKPLIGKHEVKTVYAGDEYFQNCTNTSEFWVFSQYPIDAEDTYVIYNSGKYFKARFYDEYHDILANEYVVFNIEGNDYLRLTDENGWATLDLDLDIGEYDVTSINNIYDEYTTNKLIVFTSIQSENLTRAYNSGIDFNATFLDDNAKPLANKFVEFRVNGTSMSVKTNANGQAVLNGPLAVGTYEIISINTITKENRTNSLTIVPSIRAEDMVRAYNSTVDYNASFTGANGDYLINTTVTFEIGSNKYNVVTDENGTAILNVPLAVGEYNVSTTNPVTGEKSTKKLTIVERIVNNENMIIHTDSQDYFMVVVIGDDGNVSGSGETVVFTLNDVDYPVKTDEYGYASLLISSLDKGLYSINTAYKGFTVSNNITVFKDLKSIISIDVDDVNYTETVFLNVSVLPEYGHGNLTVYIISNDEYLLEFDAGANETFAKGLVGLNASSYVIAVKFSDVDNYYLSQDVAFFEVLKIDPKLIVVVDDAEFGQTATVTVNIPQVHGNVTITIGDKKNFTEYIPENGVIIERINDLNVGEYDVTVTYNGNNNYNPVTKTSKLNITKIPSNVWLDCEDEFDYGQVVKINLTADVDGIVEIEIGDDVYFVNVKANEINKLNYSGFKAGDYYVSAYLTPNSNVYDVAYDETEIYINEISTEMVVHADDIEFGQPTNIIVIVNSNATGNVRLICGDKEYTEKIVSGGAVFKIMGLEVGNYSLEVIYDGDDNFEWNYDFAEFEVRKVQKFNVEVPSAVQNNNNSLTIGLPTDAGGSIVFTINNKDYVSSVVHGEANIDLSALANGNYTYTLNYSGDKKYEAFIKQGYVKISKVETELIKTMIISSDVICEYNSSSYVAATLKDAKGNLLSNKEITIKIGDKSYSKVSDGNGQVSLLIDLYVGNYTSRITFSGDDKYDKSSALINISVIKAKLPQLAVKTSFDGQIIRYGYYGQYESIYVSNLPKGADGKLTLYIDGIEIEYPGDAYDDEGNKVDGFSFDVYDLDEGVHVWQLRFTDDSLYDDTSASGSFTISDYVYQPDIYQFALITNKSVINVPFDKITWDTKTILVYDTVYKFFTFALDGINYTAASDDSNIAVLYVSFNPDDYKQYDGVYYKVNDGQIVDIIGQDEYDVYDNEYYRFVGVGYKAVSENIDDAYYCIVKGEVYKIVGSMAASTSFFYKAVENEDYKVVNGKYYTLGGELINETMGDYVDNDYGVINGTFYDIYANYYRPHPTWTLGYELIKNNGEFSRIVYGNNGTSYAVSKGKLCSVVGDSIGNAVNIDMTQEIEDAVIPDLNKPSSDGTVTIELPADATGSVTLTVNGKNYTFDVSNGVANVKLPELLNGDYPYTITYSGDNKYSSFNTSGSLNVNNPKPVPDVVIPPLDKPSSGGSVAITLPSDATGTVTLSVNGKNYTFTVSKGVANVIIPELANGEYLYNISYSGDNRYSSFNTSGSFTIYNPVKPVPDVVIPPLDKPSADGSVVVKLPSDATGIVTLTINDKNYHFAVVDGVANLIIPELGDGDYPYTITYSGDDKYSSFNTSGSLSIDNSKPVPEVVIPPLDKPSDDGSIEVKLPADATGTVTLTIDDKNYHFTVSNGVANVKLPELEDGDYQYTITYSGDTKYSSFNSSGSLNVINPKPVPEVVIPPLDQASDDGSVIVKLPSDASGIVTLIINNNQYHFAVVNGVANVIIPNLGEGSYPYTITYSGDSKYSSFTTNGTLNKVAPAVDPVITASNVKVTYATGKYYTIKVYGTDGKLADGAKVVIKVKGKTFKTLTTTKGVAKFKVTNVPGTYKMNITALGKSVTKTLTVKHLVILKSVTVKKSAKKLTLQATLGKVNGKYLKNKKITFKFNGKKYTAKTNKKGVAKVTIKSSILKKLKVGKKVTYQATYSKDTVKKTVKVKK